MSDKDMAARIEELESELAEMKSIVGADVDFRRQIEDQPYGLERLRRAERKTGYPNDRKEDDGD